VHKRGCGSFACQAMPAAARATGGRQPEFFSHAVNSVTGEAAGARGRRRRGTDEVQCCFHQPENPRSEAPRYAAAAPGYGKQTLDRKSGAEYIRTKKCEEAMIATRIARDVARMSAQEGARSASVRHSAACLVKSAL